MAKTLIEAIQTAQLLTAAKQVIASPAGWMKGAFCNGPHGGETCGDTLPSDYAAATRFCALGAIRRITNVEAPNLERVQEQADNALSAAVGEAQWKFNDGRNTTHADVMAMFDLAIEEQYKIVKMKAAKNDPDLPHKD